MALRHRPYNIPDRYRGVADELFDNINPVATVEAGSNILGHTWDYWNEQGDFARPAKWQKTEGAEIMEADSTNQIEAPVSMDTMSARAGSSGAAPGPKGALVGKTQTKKGYESYFHERQWAHSKKIRHHTLLWSFSIYDQPYYDDTYKLSLYKWGKQGLVCIKENQYIDSGENISIWKPHYTGVGACAKNLSDNVLACSLNLYIDDFYDKKLYDNNKKTGIFTNFNKIRLKSITVTLTPRTYIGGTLNQAQWIWARTERLTAPEGGDKRYYPAYYAGTRMKELDMDYWVYRDIYGAYHQNISNDQVIPDVPPEATSDTPPSLSRTCRTVRAHDNNLDTMSNKKPFSFTREVSSTGNYFISASTLSANRGKAIHSLINELEGQIGTSTYINKFPEYLGMLIVPKHMPVQFFGQTTALGTTAAKEKAYIIDSTFHTILEIKYNATWECFDFKHSDYSTAAAVSTFTSETIKEIDPLIYAERDLAAAMELENMKKFTN